MYLCNALQLAFMNVGVLHVCTSKMHGSQRLMTALLVCGYRRRLQHDFWQPDVPWEEVSMECTTVADSVLARAPAPSGSVLAPPPPE